jgi:hypothetical protein
MFNEIEINLGNIKGFNTLLHDEITDTSNILKLNKSECKTENNQQYKIITYDKKVLNYDLVETYGLCRSVIANSENDVVSFAPPKSLQADNFLKLYPIKTDDIVAEEFIEGTMINVFFDPTIGLTGGWEITTKKVVGATCLMNSGEKEKENENQKDKDNNKDNVKTFRSMFLEAAKKNNLYLESLNKSLCYSFVMQHPNNRIVIPIKEPQLYLVAIFRIDNSDKNNIKVFYRDIEEIKNANWFDANIKFPETYNCDDYAILIDTYASMNTSYDRMGFILYNRKTGHRTKIRNPVYEEVKYLRGNKTKLQYQYLTLRREGKVNEFLKTFPENKRELSSFRDQLHLFTNTLYENYISCYIKKEKILKDYSPQYRTHMFYIHQKYLTELKEQKLYITNKVVIDYVNSLDVKLLLQSINYNIKQREVDVINVSNIV